jgi:predicted component of type VI protein secretion system
MAAIRVIAKGNQIDRREVGSSLVIGRADECDLRVIDGDVSRRHCRIERMAEGYFVVDLGSRNGTLVDGARITRRALRDGDLLRVGNHTIQFESGIPTPRTFDDEVLEMLNDVAPSPTGNLDAFEEVGAQMREEYLPVERPLQATAAVAPAALGTARPTARLTPNLWEKAIAGPAPSLISAPTHKAQRDKRCDSNLPQRPARGSPAASRGRAADGAPWYRRTVSVPVAIGLAVAAAIGLYLMTGPGLVRSSAAPPQKVLPHSSSLNRD